MRRVEAGGADDHGGAALGRDLRVLDRRGRRGEVDEHVGSARQRRRVGGSGEPEQADAGELADVADQKRVAGRLDPADEDTAGRGVHFRHQHPPHEAAAAQNADARVGHGRLPFLSPFSSWPDATRPFTRFRRCGRCVDAQVKPGHDENGGYDYPNPREIRRRGGK